MLKTSQPSQQPKIEPEAIAANGWKFFEKCKCERILKYKYHHPDHPGLELEWWPKYFQFRITQYGRNTKVPPTAIGSLDKTLKEL